MDSTFDVIDKVYCISLEHCHLRQVNARDQLSKIGVDSFEFFWGTGRDDSIVSEYFDRNLVLTFPPCFRCGKRSCGSETCNNFLIPAQVATFITYKRLWEEIVSSGTGIALIVEDDFVFTDYGPKLFHKVLNESAFNSHGIKRDSESLVRLGWFRCEEHKELEKAQLVNGLLRMSNPCHVITLGMAKRLLREFDTIKSPVDTYIHDKIGMQVNNYTIYPPIAYDLSWSAGAVESLIHPKAVRIGFLENFQPENKEQIAEARKQVAMHFMHKLVRDVLCVGHPRCGSGYMSKLLKMYGLDVRHEEMGGQGISSWMFAVDDEQNPYALNKYALSSRHTVFDHVIHYVRNPGDAIPGIIRENQQSEISYVFRRKHIMKMLNVDLNEYISDIDKAVASYVYWNKIIEKSGPDIVVRVEDCEQEISRYLVMKQLVDADASFSDYPDKSCNSDKPYLGIYYQKPVVTDSDWAALDGDLRKELENLCNHYGYDSYFL